MFTTTSETREVALNNELKAELIVTRVGQEVAGAGDKVIVVAEIRLPAKEEYSHSRGHKYAELAPEIQFWGRVRVCGNKLESAWGFDREEEFSYRYDDKKIIAPTWKEAFAEAFRYGEAELQSLIEALAAREKALEDADAD